MSVSKVAVKLYEHLVHLWGFYHTVLLRHVGNSWIGEGRGRPKTGEGIMQMVDL